MTCPKCQGSMRSYERNQVTVDQCIDCRGIFLDRGELERLVDAELSFSRSASPAVPENGGYEDERYRAGHEGKGHHEKDKYRKGKRRSFLGELFD